MTRTQFVGVSVAYALLNVVVMLAFAKSLLGPTPFEFIWGFLAISAAGTVAALFVRSPSISWPANVAISLLFATLTAFNWWCLLSASDVV